jgi:hypothetical protein
MLRSQSPLWNSASGLLDSGHDCVRICLRLRLEIKLLFIEKA